MFRSFKTLKSSNLKQIQIEIGGFLNISEELANKQKLAVYLNFIINKVAEFYEYQPWVGSNHLLSVESSKIKKQKSVSHIKLL